MIKLRKPSPAMSVALGVERAFVASGASKAN